MLLLLLLFLLLFSLLCNTCCCVILVYTLFPNGSPFGPSLFGSPKGTPPIRKSVFFWVLPKSPKFGQVIQLFQALSLKFKLLAIGRKRQDNIILMGGVPLREAAPKEVKISRGQIDSRSK